MDIHQLKTFVTVAREGSITRASEILHLSQPAVSAHIKAIEDALGLALFDRNARGMSLTADGERLLAKAEQTLASHRELLEEATRIKGHVTGRLRIGAGNNASHEALGRLLTTLAQRCPEVEVSVKHATSSEILTGLRNGTLDAGFYNEAGDTDADLTTIEVSRFRIWIVAAPGVVAPADNREPDWRALADVPWIYPPASTCCGRTAESLFKTHKIRPKRTISVDREDVTRTLIAGGIGVGLLHATTAREAEARREVELVHECPTLVRVLFTHTTERAQDPILSMAASIMRG